MVILKYLKGEFSNNPIFYESSIRDMLISKGEHVPVYDNQFIIDDVFTDSYAMTVPFMRGFDFCDYIIPPFKDILDLINTKNNTFDKERSIIQERIFNNKEFSLLKNQILKKYK